LFYLGYVRFPLFCLFPLFRTSQCYPLYIFAILFLTSFKNHLPNNKEHVYYIYAVYADYYLLKRTKVRRTFFLEEESMSAFEWLTLGLTALSVILQAIKMLRANKG